MNQVHQPPTGRTMEQMFSLQRRILAEYKIREDLPEWPWNIDERKTQNLLRKFVSRLVEEMGEAAENLYLGFDAISTNHGEEAQEYIRRYNEELADVWHFFLEILMFSGIDENSLGAWMANMRGTGGPGESLFNPENLMKSFISFAAYKNQQDGLTTRNRMNEFVIYPEPEIFSEGPENMGARSLSERTVEGHDTFFWRITQQLMKAMNQLKTRDWNNVEERIVNRVKYNESIMEAFIFFMRLMEYTRKTELSIYNSYVLKNEINWERLQTS